MKLTVFTPTFNRENTLKVLYESLLIQSCKDFCWLIVDDGSTDRTEELVNQWIKEGKLEIKYYKQKNMGKAQAHNLGVSYADSTLFTCVDSDDYLDPDAVDAIIKSWEDNTNQKIIGVLAFKAHPDGSPITALSNNKIQSTTLQNAYRRLKMTGDTMLAYKTDIISKYTYPQIEGEKFVPDAYIYDLLDKEGELLLLRRILCYCQYLPDGYTQNISRVIALNPHGYLLYIKNRLSNRKDISATIMDTIRYQSVALIKPNRLELPKGLLVSFIAVLVLPISFLQYWIRFRKYIEGRNRI